MAKKKKLNPKTVNNFIKKEMTKIDELQEAINKTVNSIHTFEKGGSDKLAYWTGNRAYVWFGNAKANIFNDYADCARISKVFMQLSDAAAKVANKNNDTTTYGSLKQKAGSLEQKAVGTIRRANNFKSEG